MTRLAHALARIMALLGGIVLTGLVVMTCISVLGRGLASLGHGGLPGGILPGLAGWLAQLGPVRGDYELVEAGIAFAIFAFLPICQLYGGHATVDLFTSMMRPRANAWVTAFWEIVLAVVIVVIGWRLHAGFTEKLANGQTSFLLQFPIWWAYGASLVAAIVAGLVGLWCAIARLIGALTGRDLLARGSDAASEAQH